MRVFIALLLSFQFINAPRASEVGEHQEFNINSVTLKSLTDAQREVFVEDADQQMERLIKLGIKSYAATVKEVSPTEQKELQQLLGSAEKESLPKFSKISKGMWTSKIGMHQVTVTYTDLYLNQVLVDGKVLSLKGKSIAELKASVLALIAKKTSWYQPILNQFKIEEAQAMEPISALVIIVVAAAILGTALYYAHYKPKKTVEKLKLATAQLRNKATACDKSAENESLYQDTFALASNISERTTVNSLTSVDDVLNLEIKKQISSGKSGEMNCGQQVTEAAKKFGLDVPTADALQKAQERRELMGSNLEAVDETDVSGAMMALCSQYNKLASCMGQFVKKHVNDSGVESFKDNARHDFYRYQRNSGSQQ
ncbi:MAG: hypothetical protein K2P81_07630 [Bacteriovoracaceae bacterium]|nr:hypothetical protein [Bacteriovoracaceae bacterium]